MINQEKMITDISGVYSSAIHAGFKADALDLAYIYVPNAVASAGVFTTNQCASETIRYTQKIMKRSTLKAIVINSGNANTATGQLGKLAVKETVRITSKQLGLQQSEVGVASTGVIGVPLPLNIMTNGLTRLLKEPLKKEGHLCSKAILTTDLVTKTVFLEKKIGKKMIQVAGICKGSGMIAPNMATMLAYLVTNVHLTNDQFQSCLKIAVNESFNCITVDSDTSTSDMVVGFATGERQINWKSSDERAAFQELLTEVCRSLATQIVKDGEGVTKLIELTVLGAVTQTEAKQVAMSVLNSPLVKTAIHGEDPNWGRLMMAIGKTSGIKLNSHKLSIAMGGYWLVKAGQPTAIDLSKVKQALKQDTVLLTIDLGLGSAQVRAWGCDLSKQYIDINVDYN